ncbi:MAG TPA: trypsin-like peptidase domain-containing protein [Candidatus Limnocylindria bacterium]|nr:trypsin-like peptidase domain-containing protein [Candidatus Limnocylindria bacterium]
MSAVRIAIRSILLGAIATSCVVPQTAESPTPEPLASAPPPPAAPSGAGAGTSEPIVAVVQDLLPSVVTVINKLSNGQPQSSGSGFIVDANRGYIVTNNHVVENVRDTDPGAAFDVVFSDNRKLEAKLVGRDQLTDLAVLQVNAQNLKAATLGDSDAVPVGSTVVAIGSPLGEFQNTVTAGIVSAKGRRVAESQSIFLEDLVQTDAAINEGNSGGPLIWAATHQVIGVNTLVASNASGLGFAISSNTVRQIADELIKNGKVVRGFIGVQYTQLSARQGAQLGLPTGTTGIIVTQVVRGSPAAQAGIRVNDIITTVNDQMIDPQHPLQSVMVKFRPGDKVKLTLIRDGKAQTVDLTLGQPQ